MAHKQMLLKLAARERILRGATSLADAVRVTLGPEVEVHPHRAEVGATTRDGGVVVDRVRSGTGNFGYDAATGRYVDLVEAGIIDPTKVVRLALENAVSVAGVLLLAEGTLTEIPTRSERPEPVEG